jgi:hypothetical protein
MALMQATLIEYRLRFEPAPPDGAGAGLASGGHRGDTVAGCGPLPRTRTEL